MLDFLTSPIIFPSDMDSPKLSADPTFKLPAAMNWTDHDYENAPLDKPMTKLTDLVQLEPISDKDSCLYAPFILDDFFKHALNDDKHAALSNPPLFTLPPLMDLRDDDSGYGDDDDDNNNVKQKALRANLRGALAVVENDMQQNRYEHLYAPTRCQGEQWSWHEEMLDVPELVHSECSSSAQSMADPTPTTPVFLESGISFLVEKNFVCGFRPGNPQPLPDMTSPGKKWLSKLKQATSTMKQDCVKSLTKTSRKLSRWIRH